VEGAPQDLLGPRTPDHEHVGCGVLGGKLEALGPVASDGGLLVGQGRAVPHLDEHPNPADHQVRTSGHPVAAAIGPDPSIHGCGIVGIGIHRSVEETLEVTTRAPGVHLGTGAEAVLHPAHHREALGRPGEGVDGVVGGLVVVGGHLDDEVAVGPVGAQLVPGKGRQGGQGHGPTALEAEAPVKQ